MKATQTAALLALTASMLTSGPTHARDWRWYPRKAPADAGALMPDLEGTRNEDPEQRGTSELEELRLWLQRRDEDRRRQGITVPDTVEQLEPAGDITVRRRQWPDGSARPPATDGDSSGPIIGGEQFLDEQSERVRDTLVPHFFGKRHPHFARHSWRRRDSPWSRHAARHPTSGYGRKHGITRRRH